MINKRDLIRSRTPFDTELRYQLSQIPNKVDKELNKGLSTNDFTNEYKDELDRTIENIHHHNNLGVLNSIGKDDVEMWKEAYNIASQLINPVEIFNLVEGSNESLSFAEPPLNYKYLLIIYGTTTDYENKLIMPTEKEFCILLNTKNGNTLKSFYTINENGFEKVSGDNIYVYKVLGYFKKEEM